MQEKAFDFCEEYREPYKLLNNGIIRQLVDNHLFSIKNMSPKELLESIVEDILMVTMWEIQTGIKLHFGYTKLVEFLPRSLHPLVYENLRNPEISGLIEITDSKFRSKELRIKNDRAILQAAMDYAGVWYSGFEQPTEGVISLSLLREKVQDMGGIDAASQSIAMDLMANTALSTTKQ